MMSAMLAMPGHSDDGELDAGLLSRCQAGEQAALRVFVERYQRAVFALVSRIIGQRPEVEDLAQETFLRAIRALPAAPGRAGRWEKRCRPGPGRAGPVRPRRPSHRATIRPTQPRSNARQARP